MSRRNIYRQVVEERVTSTSHSRNAQWAVSKQVVGGGLNEDREKGRIAGWAKKRREAYDFTIRLLPMLRQARIELSDPTKEISLRAIADWLNAREMKSIKGKRFHAPTIDRILGHSGEHLRKFAKYEHDRAAAIVKFKKLPDQQERLDALAQTLADRITESEELDRQLAMIQKFTAERGS